LIALTTCFVLTSNEVLARSVQVKALWVYAFCATAIVQWNVAVLYMYIQMVLALIAIQDFEHMAACSAMCETV